MSRIYQDGNGVGRAKVSNNCLESGVDSGEGETEGMECSLEEKGRDDDETRLLKVDMWEV